jgi:FkbM family methyltransferase
MFLKSARAANSALSVFGLRLIRIARSGNARPRTTFDFIRSRRINMVIDVGANEGQFGMSLRNAGYTGLIKSFEPVAAPFRMLSAVASKELPWEVFNFGLSDREEEREINVSKDTVFSSLKNVTSHAALFDENSARLYQERIHLCRIDDVMQVDKSFRTFLKIDTQGYEERVLNGAINYMAGVHGVMLEIPIKHLYDDVWNFEEAVAFMRKHSFIISNILPVNYDHNVDDVSLIEVDCIFKNINIAPSARL